MPLPTKWHKKKKSPPPGFDYVEPVLEALENELRDQVKECDAKKRKAESLWPVHQINWQKTRYIYDMYYTYGKIDRKCYEYIIEQKLVDAALIAKWKKPGYEKLCSTYVINPINYKYGTNSICRVPYKDRTAEQKKAKDPTTGCLGCASGSGGGPRNIFGTKYGQNLAAVQIAREKRLQAKHDREEEAAAAAAAAQRQQQKQDNNNDDDDDDDASTDVEEAEDDDDYGPSPAAGIWAGSQKLLQESETLADGGTDDKNDPDGEAETDQEDNDEAQEEDHREGGDEEAEKDDIPPATKKTKVV